VGVDEAGEIPLAPIFVVGVPRSGTTWVQRLLAAGPDAFPLLETYMFSGRVGLGALFRPVPYDAGDEAPAASPPGLGRLFTRGELIEQAREIARRWLAAGVPSGTRFAVEKSPWHLHELRLIAEVLPEARFVYVLRDGRDVAISLLEARRSWSGFGTSDPDEVVTEAATSWSNGCALAAAASPELGERMLEVRYERLRGEARASSAELFAHCGIPATAAEIDHAVDSTDIERGGQPSGEGRAIRAGRVGEWRERFGIRDARRFERIAGATLVETGYELDRRWWLRQPLRSRL
jgi:hypothetical protein